MRENEKQKKKSKKKTKRKRRRSFSESKRNLNILHRCREQEIDWFIKMIISFNPFSLSIVFLSILSFLNLTTPATGANYLFHFCANSTFSANSLYQTGINSLLSSLSSNAHTQLRILQHHHKPKHLQPCLRPLPLPWFNNFWKLPRMRGRSNQISHHKLLQRKDCCDLVRWMHDTLLKWVYFLYCDRKA